MRTLSYATAFVVVAGAAGAAGPPGAPPSIADSPPPGPRSDLGAIVDPTIELTAETPYVAGRGSLRVLTDADTAAWTTNGGAAVFHAAAGNRLFWPYQAESNLPQEL